MGRRTVADLESENDDLRSKLDEIADILVEAGVIDEDDDADDSQTED